MNSVNSYLFGLNQKFDLRKVFIELLFFDFFIILNRFIANFAKIK